MPLFASRSSARSSSSSSPTTSRARCSRRDRRRLEKHLRACDGCAAYLESVRVTVRSLGELPPEPADPHVREHLLAAFHELRG